MHISRSSSNVISAFCAKFLNTCVLCYMIFRVGGRENFFHCEKCGMSFNFPDG